jgi:hypothetical protein
MKTEKGTIHSALLDALMKEPDERTNLEKEFITKCRERREMPDVIIQMPCLNNEDCDNCYLDNQCYKAEIAYNPKEIMETFVNKND